MPLVGRVDSQRAQALTEAMLEAIAREQAEIVLLDITGVADTKKAACYAHASQSPDFFYSLQDTVAVFRGFQAGSKKAEGYIFQIGSPYNLFPRAGLAEK